MKTIFMIFTVSSATVLSQLILKKGVSDLKIESFSLEVLVRIVTSPWILTSLVLQASSFIIWVLVLSRANLGYAFGFSGGFFYIILPLLSWVIFGERLNLGQWFGLILITAGVLCLLSNGRVQS